jgi:hypothetical protein
MNLVNLLKKKLANEIRKQHTALRQRRQLNMMVDERLINETKDLAAQFTVPRYCLVEHLLETGYYYLTRAIENEKKTKMLRQHLIHVHLIDSGIDDSEAILRIGEGSNISQLLFQIRPVLRSWQTYRHAIVMAKNTRNNRDITYVERCQRKLMESVIMFALWIEQHSLDEPDNNDIDDQQLEADSDGESTE